MSFKKHRLSSYKRPYKKDIKKIDIEYDPELLEYEYGSTPRTRLYKKLQKSSGIPPRMSYIEDTEYLSPLELKRRGMSGDEKERQFYLDENLYEPKIKHRKLLKLKKPSKTKETEYIINNQEISNFIDDIRKNNNFYKWRNKISKYSSDPSKSHLKDLIYLNDYNLKNFINKYPVQTEYVTRQGEYEIPSFDKVWFNFSNTPGVMSQITKEKDKVIDIIPHLELSKQMKKLKVKNESELPLYKEMKRLKV